MGLLGFSEKHDFLPQFKQILENFEIRKPRGEGGKWGKKRRAEEGNFFFFPQNTYFSLSSQASPNRSSFGARFNKNPVC